MFEHAYYCRDGDEARAVFRFTNVVAPTKACVFPLLAKAELNEVRACACVGSVMATLTWCWKLILGVAPTESMHVPVASRGRIQ